MYDQSTRTHTLTGLTVNTRYTCCVEANFKQVPLEVIGCNSINLSPPGIGNPTTDISTTSEATPTGSTEHAQTVGQGNMNESPTYTQGDVTGLYVVIALLCVLVAISTIGWVVTGIVAYFKIEHSR